MNRVATFEKVSFEQFKNDFKSTYEVDSESLYNMQLKAIYERINIPERKTIGSAGHDFESPISFTLKPFESIRIATGIRCWMNDGYVMLIMPRSSIGNKYHICISNTVPVIDSDYYNAANEGHIFIQLENRGDKEFKMKAGETFAQAVFVPFGVADTKMVNGKRTGGEGSTGL